MEVSGMVTALCGSGIADARHIPKVMKNKNS